MLDPAIHESIARHGDAALAWEVLRRDPAYRAAFTALPKMNDHSIAADASFVARWGVHFR
jgi:hypothetical protein